MTSERTPSRPLWCFNRKVRIEHKEAIHFFAIFVFSAVNCPFRALGCDPVPRGELFGLDRRKPPALLHRRAALRGLKWRHPKSLFSLSQVDATSPSPPPASAPAPGSPDCRGSTGPRGAS